MTLYCDKCGARHDSSVCPSCSGFGKSPPMTAPDDVRARFEAWVVTQPWFSACIGLTMTHDAYADPCINSRWQGYRAAHAALSGDVRELVRASQAILDGLAVAEPVKRGLFQELRVALAKFTQEKP